MYWKSFSMMIAQYYVISCNGQNYASGVPKEFRKFVIIRGIIGFLGLNGIWGGIKFVPMSIASCIFYSAPIFTALLSGIFLGEHMTKYDFIAVIFAFFGVILVNDPFLE